MSSERSVKDLSGLYRAFMERAMGIEPTSEVWEMSGRPYSLLFPIHSSPGRNSGSRSQHDPGIDLPIWYALQLASYLRAWPVLRMALSDAAGRSRG